MSIQPDQLLRYVIRPALRDLGPCYATRSAERLIMATCAQETHCGRWLHQVNGPALGITQVEPATAHDLYLNYLAYRDPILPPEDPERLIYDLHYAVQVTRLQYFRFPAPLPEYHDLDGFWCYYKEHWNSWLGDATRDQFVANWCKYVVRSGA